MFVGLFLSRALPAYRADHPLAWHRSDVLVSCTCDSWPLSSLDVFQVFTCFNTETTRPRRTHQSSITSIHLHRNSNYAVTNKDDKTTHMAWDKRQAQNTRGAADLMFLSKCIFQENSSLDRVYIRTNVSWKKRGRSHKDSNGKKKRPIRRAWASVYSWPFWRQQTRGCCCRSGR